MGTSDYRAGVTWRTDKPCDEHRGPLGLLKTKGPASASPFSPLLDAGVDFYFLAFFAFFFFTIVSSFCSDLGKSEIWLEPINGPNPFNSKSRDLFHTMVNKIEVLS